jgi:hypothetical protein
MIWSRKTRASWSPSKRLQRPRPSVERLEDRTLPTAVTLLNNGPSSNRVDILFMGDGYTAADIAAGTYRSHVESMVKHLFADGQDPYPRYRNFFNVHMLEVVSSESGIDNPIQQFWRNTALDATYDCSGLTRLICIDESKARLAAVASPVPADIRLVTTNSSDYGGSGGFFAVYAGGNYASTEIALHELGHTFDGFGDEYASGCGTYTGPEPVAANLTTSAAGAKWSQWIGYEQPSIGRIGAYEGGGYCQWGIYRPSPYSKMRTLGMPFDAVEREKIILDIYSLVDPLDDWVDNRTARGGDERLWVKVVDPNVIRVNWFVDGKAVPGATAENFRPSEYRVPRGTHTVTARAFDPTDWVRRDRDHLEQSVTWAVQVQTDSVPGPSLGTASPTVENVELVASGRRAITEIVLTLSDDASLSQAELENVAHYHVATPGRDRRFGTRDDRVVAIGSAVYNAARSTMVLTPTKPQRPNQLFQVALDFTPSVANRAPSPLPADGTSTDGDYAMIVGRGTKLSYVDTDGDVVSLVLAHGGVMELTMSPSEQAPRLRLLDTIASRSVLAGKLRQGRPNGDRIAHLESVSGLSGVRNNLALPGSPFVVGSTSAAIDALLESEERPAPLPLAA